jgi:S-(hydroxymethyl)glutathione dehydrogenase/alcohol dehydrogenase
MIPQADYLCFQAIRAYTGKGVMPDETKRFTCKGKELYHYMGVSSFSKYTVVSQYSLVSVDKDAPQEKTCLLGCGISTGFVSGFFSRNLIEAGI